MDFLRGWPRNPDDGLDGRVGATWASPLVPGRGLVLTVGSFDGLHRGHQSLIERARTLADAERLPLAALFFEPTAREYLSPATAPPRVLPLASKLVRLAELGVDLAWCLRFGRELAGMEATEFAARLAAMGVRVVVAGDDFRYGRGRAGDARLLERHGIDTLVVPAVSTVFPAVGPDAMGETVRCSSTGLRELLARGEVGRAEAVLGTPYRLIGRVRRGRQLGRTLGCPTANLVFRRRLALAHGVYAGTAQIADDWARATAGATDASVPTPTFPAVASFGVRPTLEGGLAPWLEVHLLDTSLDLYGRYLTFHPRHFLRAEARFASLDELTRAIVGDMAAARAWLAAHPTSSSRAEGPGVPAAPAPLPEAGSPPFSPAAGRFVERRLAITP